MQKKKFCGSDDDERRFQNALFSWHCVRRQQRWFRCLEREYLVLKCFLLERFLHDVVFESASPHIIAEFLGVQL